MEIGALRASPGSPGSSNYFIGKSFTRPAICLGKTDCNQHIDQLASFGVVKTLSKVTFSKADFALTVKEELGIQMP